MTQKWEQKEKHQIFRILTKTIVFYTSINYERKIVLSSMNYLDLLNNKFCHGKPTVVLSNDRVVNLVLFWFNRSFCFFNVHSVTGTA